MKRIALIGSTGSIGRNTLEVISRHPGLFSVHALAARSNVEALVEQAEKFHPQIVAIFDTDKKSELEQRLSEKGLHSLRILDGIQGLIDSVTSPEVDQVLLALTGSEGIHPLIGAIRAKKQVALANKEPLVMAGEIIRKLAREYGTEIIPIDSEHSGIFQCLEGRRAAQISRMYLTASGGPFLKRDLSTFDRITPEEAIEHPRWSMGKKISVDSATLMNKGLEVIEAKSLFGIGMDQIEILIHPEAIMHAIVEFEDGTQIAQMSVTDMKLPIQYALSYPRRLKSNGFRLNLSEIGALHFRPVDAEKFPCVRLAYEAGKKEGTAPAVLNASNEVCVNAFLKREIAFTEISKIIEQVLREHRVILHPNLDVILNADEWARQRSFELIQTKVSL